MYEAKSKGRARYAVFHDGMRVRAREALQLNKDLRVLPDSPLVQVSPIRPPPAGRSANPIAWPNSCSTTVNRSSAGTPPLGERSPASSRCR